MSFGNPFAFAADLLDPPQIKSKWYCNRENCDGEPHEGWHWCEHPLPHPKGDEYWRCRHARAEQHPPSSSWRIWLILAGRGWGKSRTGAEWLAGCAERHAYTNWAVVAPTRDDLKATCIEGDSGILNALGMDREDPSYNKTDIVIRLPNGSTIRGLSAEKPERTRGPNLAGAWLDEVASWHYTETYTNLLPAIRRGDARIVATTTPRPIPLIKEWVKRGDGTVEVTRGSMWSNASNLSEATLNELRLRWEGTRMGRQELYGELLEDTPGALWSAEVIELTRCRMSGIPKFEDLIGDVA